MTPAAVAQAIRAIAEAFVVELADTPATIESCYRLRYEALRTDRHSAVEPNGLERDEFDERSKHFALICRQSGGIVGTIRLVLASADQPGHSFPMQQYCAVPLPADMPILRTAEISRCVISGPRRDYNATTLMRLGLLRGVVRVSRELGLTHWCAMMEPTLLRLLEMTSLHFNPLGPVVEYYGVRQPCCNSIAAVMERLYHDRPEIWDYLTEYGQYWPRKSAPRSMAAGDETMGRLLARIPTMA